TIWTDRLWYHSLGYDVVFTTQLWTRVGLFVVAGLLAALIVAGNAALAQRLRPPTRGGPMASPLLERYHALLQSRVRRTVLAFGVPAFIIGGSAGLAETFTFLAWRNSTEFGVADPRFGLDASFYVFDYPWWVFVAGFVFWALFFATLAAALLHYLFGGIRGRNATTVAATAHISILAGLTLLVHGVRLWLDRYGLMIDETPLLTGMTYTDSQVRVSGLTIMAAIAMISALLFLANIWLRRWSLPVVSLVLMLLSGLVVGMIYPAAIQAFQVNPDEPDTERPYIEDHMAATKAAFGISDVEIENYEAVTDTEPGQLRADAEALPGIRLIDPALIGPAFEQLQQVRGYYSFPAVLDVDRYTIDGQQTDAVVAAREMDLSGLQSQSWNNIRTVYTHGFGLVAAYGNRRQPSGDPEWMARDIPPTGALSEHEPRIYFGELHSEYSIVGAPAGAPPVELDTPGGGESDEPTLTTYTGEGGVPVGNFFNKLLYAVKFADVNIMLSDRVNEESKIIYDRTPRMRVAQAAPWLQVDSNAYPAIVEGRLVWIVDAYTTSNSYPNSHRLSLEQATSDSMTRQAMVAQPDRMVNYMRNSVKATVDAYDGTVTLYAWDEDDPVLQTWRKVFPETVQDRSEISDDLLSHLRYPEDMFKVQREVLGRYHVEDPHLWYQQTDLWVTPNDPVAGTGSKETPYYLSIRWPGDDEPVFSQTTVYVPNNRSNLASFMAVNADASREDYGKIRILRMSGQQQIDGPGQTFNAMTTDQVVAETLRPFLNQGAASAEYGNLLTLPVGGGLLYVMPVYTQRQASTGSYPALRFVVVRFGEKVAIGNTLQEALDKVFEGDSGAETGEDPSAIDDDPPVDEQPGETPTGDTPTGEDPPAEEPGTVDEGAARQALTEAEQAFEAAERALGEGDLGTYQEKNAEARAAVRRALDAMGR
ncbi:MAG: UPF0182 family protein, partial [Propionibacterium sp.]|nr:UPF0182 family protein [Propionibacterium sp.]